MLKRKPDPRQIKSSPREAAGLSKTEAAALIYTSYRVWQRWEKGERAMHPAFFELFRLKTWGSG